MKFYTCTEDVGIVFIVDTTAVIVGTIGSVVRTPTIEIPVGDVTAALEKTGGWRLMTRSEVATWLARSLALGGCVRRRVVSLPGVERDLITLDAERLTLRVHGVYFAADVVDDVLSQYREMAVTV